MISYVGVTIDELVTTFDDSLVYSDNRVGRVHAAPYVALDAIPPLKAVPNDETRADDFAPDGWKDLDEEEGDIDVFVDEDGRLHSLAESLSVAADALVAFLTDYIITDEIDDEWLTLDLARAALLGLRVSLPAFEEIPDVTCAYKFRIDRDPKTGQANFVTARALNGGTLLLDTLSRTPTHYEGVVSDETALDELFISSGIPEAERFALGEALSEAVFHLADEQCGIAFDVMKFRGEIMRLAARHRMHVVPKETHNEA